jgi:hypothetical protein
MTLNSSWTTSTILEFNVWVGQVPPIILMIRHELTKRVWYLYCTPLPIGSRLAACKHLLVNRC